MITNVNTNEVKDVIDNELKFDSKNSLANDNVQDNPPIVNISLRSGKKSRKTFNQGLTCLWYSGATKSMIKRRYINTYKYKIRVNKVKYITASGPYKTT